MKISLADLFSDQISHQFSGVLDILEALEKAAERHGTNLWSLEISISGSYMSEEAQAALLAILPKFSSLASLRIKLSRRERDFAQSLGRAFPETLRALAFHSDDAEAAEFFESFGERLGMESLELSTSSPEVFEAAAAAFRSTPLLHLELKLQTQETEGVMYFEPETVMLDPQTWPNGFPTTGNLKSLMVRHAVESEGVSEISHILDRNQNSESLSLVSPYAAEELMDALLYHLGTSIRSISLDMDVEDDQLAALLRTRPLVEEIPLKDGISSGSVGCAHFPLVAPRLRVLELPRNEGSAVRCWEIAQLRDLLAMLPKLDRLQELSVGEVPRGWASKLHDAAPKGCLINCTELRQDEDDEIWMDDD